MLNAARELFELVVHHPPSIEGNKKNLGNRKKSLYYLFNEESNIEITCGPNRLMKM